MTGNVSPSSRPSCSLSALELLLMVDGCTTDKQAFTGMKHISLKLFSKFKSIKQVHPTVVFGFRNAKVIFLPELKLMK